MMAFVDTWSDIVGLGVAFAASSLAHCSRFHHPLAGQGWASQENWSRVKM